MPMAKTHTAWPHFVSLTFQLRRPSIAACVKGARVLGTSLLGISLLASCGKKAEGPNTASADAAPQAEALTVTPPVAAGPEDAYEDVTAKAGIKFVHQFCDSRIANIIESNGAGAAILDIDNDGYMDLIVANDVTGFACTPAALSFGERYVTGVRKCPVRLSPRL